MLMLVMKVSKIEGIPLKVTTTSSLVNHIVSNSLKLISKTRYPHNVGLNNFSFTHLGFFELIFQGDDLIQIVDFIHDVYLFIHVSGLS